MPIESWLLFIPACFALNVYPGPNNLLALSNGARGGLGFATQASIGRLPAFAGLIVLTAIGLGALLAASEIWFTALKWIGAAYLIWLGIRMAMSGAEAWARKPEGAQGGLGLSARQEFLVAATNPKAIIIFTAFFPQFIAPGSDFAGQVLIMGGAFLVMEAAAALIYAFLGVRLGRLARSPRSFRWIARGSGAALVGSGILLAASRRPDTGL